MFFVSPKLGHLWLSLYLISFASSHYHRSDTQLLQPYWPTFRLPNFCLVWLIMESVCSIGPDSWVSDTLLGAMMTSWKGQHLSPLDFANNLGILYAVTNKMLQWLAIIWPCLFKHLALRSSCSLGGTIFVDFNWDAWGSWSSARNEAMIRGCTYMH